MKLSKSDRASILSLTREALALAGDVKKGYISKEEAQPRLLEIELRLRALGVPLPPN